MLWYDRDKILKDVKERKGFTRYSNDDFIPEVAEINSTDTPLLPPHPLPPGEREQFKGRDLTVIIPTLDANRDGYFPLLLEDIKRQSLKGFQVLIVKGDRRQGRAINTGASIARGKIIIILDDDVRLGHKDVFRNLVDIIKSDKRIGMAGVSNLVPDDAPWLARKVMEEVPRRSSPLVNKITDSDMAEHPCCAIPKSVFKEIGGENEIIPRGLDPYLRAEIRNKGYRVVVIPDTWIHHLPPKRLAPLIKQFFRNGRHSAYCTRFYPEWTIELAEEHGKEFKEKVSISYRSFRYIRKLMKAFFTLKWIYLLTLLCYLSGFGWGYMTSKKEV